MAVDASSYGTQARVQALVGDVVASRTFTTSTVPTLLQVEGIIDDIASEIHVALAEAGYPIETSADLTTAAPKALAWLRHLNSVGAAAMVLTSMPAGSISGTVTDEEEVLTRSQQLRSQYQRGLKSITGIGLARMGLARSTKITTGLTAGSYADKDGNVNRPFFRRGQYDFPGTRQLTEADD